MSQGPNWVGTACRTKVVFAFGPADASWLQRRSRVSNVLVADFSLRRAIRSKDCRMDLILIFPSDA
jgi:hypothetical protein